MTATTDALDDLARSYYLSPPDDIDIEETAQRHSVDILLKAVGHRPRVLEMGYGTGVITRAFHHERRDLEVVEGSPLLAARARAEHPGLVVHESLFEDFVPAKPYEAVLALHVLEHVADPVALLERIARWVPPGREIVIVTPNAESLHRHLGVAMGVHRHLDDLSDRDRLVGHRRVFTLAKLEACATLAGLRTVHRFGYFVKPVSNGMMAGWPPAAIDGLAAISGLLPAHLCANIGIVARR